MSQAVRFKRRAKESNKLRGEVMKEAAAAVRATGGASERWSGPSRMSTLEPEQKSPGKLPNDEWAERELEVSIEEGVSLQTSQRMMRATGRKNEEETFVISWGGAEFVVGAS